MDHSQTMHLPSDGIYENSTHSAHHIAHADMSMGTSNFSEQLSSAMEEVRPSQLIPDFGTDITYRSNLPVSQLEPRGTTSTLQTDPEEGKDSFVSYHSHGNRQS